MKKIILILILILLIPNTVNAVGETCTSPVSSHCCTAPAIIENMGGCPLGTYWKGDAATGECVPSVTCTDSAATSFICLTGVCRIPSGPAPEPICPLSDIRISNIEAAGCCDEGDIPLKVGTNWECAPKPTGYWDASGNNIYNNNVGNVGIGTTTPEGKLHVINNTNISSQLATIFTESGNTYNAGVYGASLGTVISPNVLIGVFGDAEGGIGGYFRSTTNGYGVFGHSISGTAGYFWSNTGYGLIVASGNVGIGMTAPGSKLQVNGNAAIGYIANTVAPANGLVVSGNVGIGIAAPTAKLEVAGQVKITGGVPGAGKILTSDATGLASWQEPAAAIGGPTWAGFTASAYNGNNTNYATANGLCNSNFVDSHVCTSEEMLSMIKAGVSLPTDSTRAWVNSGPPGYTAAQANDCAGWTSSATDSFGRYWFFITNSSGWLANCSNTYKFACCK